MKFVENDDEKSPFFRFIVIAFSLILIGMLFWILFSSIGIFQSLYQEKVYRYTSIFAVVAEVLLVLVLSQFKLSILPQVFLFAVLTGLQLMIRYIFLDNLFFMLLSWLLFSIVFFYIFKVNMAIKSVLFVLIYCVLEFTPMPQNFFALEPYIESKQIVSKIIVLAITFILGSLVDFCNRKIDFATKMKEQLEYERQVNKQLSVFNNSLQSYVRDYGVEAAETERKRITREMHDANGYHFTNIIALMNAAISSGNQEWHVIEDILHTAQSQAHEGLLDSRRVLHQLRDSFTRIKNGSISNEIFQVTRIFQECTGIEINIEWGNISNDYEETQIIAISRIIQESLVNAVKHGHATKVKISFWERNEVLSFVVEDNGQGSPKIVKGIGFTGMEERLQPFGGKLEYVNKPSGFTIMVEVPIKRKI